MLIEFLATIDNNGAIIDATILTMQITPRILTEPKFGLINIDTMPTYKVTIMLVDIDTHFTVEISELWFFTSNIKEQCAKQQAIAEKVEPNLIKKLECGVNQVIKTAKHSHENVTIKPVLPTMAYSLSTIELQHKT